MASKSATAPSASTSSPRQCRRYPCINHTYCHHTASIPRSLCVTCESIGVLELGTVETCPICLDKNRPAVNHLSGCKHMVCFQCFGVLVQPNPDILDYGFQFNRYCANDDCPGCIVCHTAWKEDQPDNYRRWLASCNEQPQFDTMSCPLCRRTASSHPSQQHPEDVEFMTSSDDDEGDDEDDIHLEPPPTQLMQFHS